jgi:hypothetical protein
MQLANDVLSDLRFVLLSMRLHSNEYLRTKPGPEAHDFHQSFPHIDCPPAVVLGLRHNRRYKYILVWQLERRKTK